MGMATCAAGECAWNRHRCRHVCVECNTTLAHAAGECAWKRHRCRQVCVEWCATPLAHAVIYAHTPFGQLDVLVGNYGGANELHRNEGGGIFSAVSSTSITQGSSSTRSVAWGDYDGDGDVRGGRMRLEPPLLPPRVCGVRRRWLTL